MPADRSGCGFYRMIEPAAAVAAAYPEWDVVVGDGLPVEVEPITRQITGVDTGGADVVVLQRPVNPHQIELIRAKGAAVVVEMDDLLSAVPHGHAGYDALVRSGAADAAVACARLADWVTVSTPALLGEYARHGRGDVVPNAIPRRLAELPPAYQRTPRSLTVGWTGYVATHPYDLQTVGSGVQQALHATGARFTVIGRAEGVARALALSEEPGEVPPIPDVAEFVTAVGDILDVGISPLRDDRFGRAKSWLKPLEYAARGVLPIYGPGPEYRRLGLGVSAVRPRDWAAAITRADRDPDWRAEQAAAAHAAVLDRHLVEHTAHLWAAAWKSAADQRTRAD